ncbi:hypothetical protein SAMN05216431_106108 [Ligilactobacillus sp. WC1T17]|uniref:Uncharacterized protein n=1 Tax=Ligilactobacillus ruminis TaxID=1623 RepID=A0ABY1ABN5_9LACO|nr:hypothetical protein SAMN05216431_106108 [Ligilactobacillus ruminis]
MHLKKEIMNFWTSLQNIFIPANTRVCPIMPQKQLTYFLKQAISQQYPVTLTLKWAKESKEVSGYLRPSQKYGVVLLHQSDNPNLVFPIQISRILYLKIAPAFQHKHLVQSQIC